jgi:hypothetical protein
MSSILAIDTVTAIQIIVFIISLLLAFICVAIGKTLGFSKPWLMIAIGFVLFAVSRLVFIPSGDKDDVITVIAAIIMLVGLSIVLYGKILFYKEWRKIVNHEHS